VVIDVLIDEMTKVLPVLTHQFFEVPMLHDVLPLLPRKKKKKQKLENRNNIEK